MARCGKREAPPFGSFNARSTLEGCWSRFRSTRDKGLEVLPYYVVFVRVLEPMREAFSSQLLRDQIPDRQLLFCLN